MMKKFKFKVLQEGLKYEQALYELEENGAMITRPEWKGYHFRYFDNYGIRMADGEVIVNPSEIHDKDKVDWMVIDVDDSEVIHVFKQLEKMNIECNLKEDEKQVNNLLFTF